MDNFNLIDSPWIPVRWHHTASGDTASLVSLHEAFDRGTDIADLDCAPHERIALTRLLVCITHAALGAPEDADEWDGFGKDFATAICAYLRKPEIYPHFNLLGDGPRFLQEAVPKTSKAVSCSKLFLNLATGNNPTLLDHSGTHSERSFYAHSVALALLTFQNFYPLYGAGFKGRGPCSDGNSIHTLLYSETLKNTILSNLIDKETVDRFLPRGFGKPIWECNTSEELSESTLTYLGRLVPRHRSLKLTDDITKFLHHNVSLQYQGWEPYREPSSTVILNKKEKRKLLPAKLDRAIWRDLHSITAFEIGIGVSKQRSDAAPILISHSIRLANQSVNIWTGGLVTDLKAKIFDVVESTFTLPRKMLLESGRHTYLAGINYAETISQKLYGAIKRYWSTLKHETAPVGEGQKHYWHRLDQEHLTLIRLASDPESFIGKPAIGTTEAKDPWTELIRKAALNAFGQVCPRTTPRQYQAYANGIKPLFGALYPKDKENKRSRKTSKETTQVEMSR